MSYCGGGGDGEIKRTNEWTDSWPYFLLLYYADHTLIAGRRAGG